MYLDSITSAEAELDSSIVGNTVLHISIIYLLLEMYVANG